MDFKLSQKSKYWANLANRSSDADFIETLLRDIQTRDPLFASSLSYPLSDLEFKKFILKQVNRIKYELRTSNFESGLVLAKTIIRILDAQQKNTWLRILEISSAEEIFDLIQKNNIMPSFNAILETNEFKDFLLKQIGSMKEKTIIRKTLLQGKIGLEEVKKIIENLKKLWDSSTQSHWNEIAKNLNDEELLTIMESAGISNRHSNFRRSILAHIGLAGNQTAIRKTLLNDHSASGLLDLKDHIELLEKRWAKMAESGEEKEILMEIIQRRIENAQELKALESKDPVLSVNID